MYTMLIISDIVSSICFVSVIIILNEIIINIFSIFVFFETSVVECQHHVEADYNADRLDCDCPQPCRSVGLSIHCSCYD